MGRLNYVAIMSADGYIADNDGNFDWAEPDAEVHAFVNDLDRQNGTHLYGRRTYEIMQVWQTLPTGPDEPAEIRDYATLWRAIDKVVFSTSLAAVTTPRTQLMREFDLDFVRNLKATATQDISIGGPTLAASAIRPGLIDDYHFFQHPILIGGGLRALPDSPRIGLELVSERRFAGGVVYTHYRSAGSD
ncbi:deaminase [bacterium SCGC AG-212-C10]|nr:deaminase [bacterium SCGC AG-212-C10]